MAANDVTATASVNPKSSAPGRLSSQVHHFCVDSSAVRPATAWRTRDRRERNPWLGAVLDAIGT